MEIEGIEDVRSVSSLRSDQIYPEPVHPNYEGLTRSLYGAKLVILG
jgi:hypothetical protein